MESHKHLKQARENLIAIKKIFKDADPASGIAFGVRRGVPQDNEDVESDNVMRPWVTFSASDVIGKKAIQILVAGLEESISFWEKATKRDIEEAQKILDNK